MHKTFHPATSFGEEISLWLSRFTAYKTAPKGIMAVRGVDLELRKGEVLALVGESGSGKSTLGRIMAGLYLPKPGQVLFEGHNLATFDKAALKNFRKKTQIMFQDPASSLNPRQKAINVIEEGLIIHQMGSKQRCRQLARDIFQEVGLSSEAENKYSHQFSGGQRQRLSLARALALSPEILIADEPVSALDVSIQAQIINLLLDLKEKRNLTLVLISHDLPLVRIMADRIAVMYGGRLMEICPKESLGRIKHHPYLLALWNSAQHGQGLLGEPPDPKNPPLGCPFAPRCPEGDDACRHDPPPPMRTLNEVSCACHKRP
ncbi:MAG: ABC transporter ATP-binding protein [Candidatus Adiutrix sp.]